MDLNVNIDRTIDGAPQVGPTYVEPLPVIDLEAFEREKQLLPPLPQVMTQIDELLRSGKSDVRQISELVCSEVSLVARILRVVNSAYYGLPTEVADITHAIALLGFREIHRIVLTASVAEAFKDLNPVQLTRFWKHSFYTALIAKEIARRDSVPIESGVLWPAALLHDVGELVYMRLFSDHYSALLDHQAKHQTTMDEAEDRLNFPSHRDIGAELCDHWNLPSTVKDACLNHGKRRDDFVDEKIYLMRRTVSAADMFATLALETLHEEVQGKLRGTLCTMLHRSEADVLRVLGEVVGWRPEVERMVSG